MKQIIKQADRPGAWPGRPLAAWPTRVAALGAAFALALAGCGAQPGSTGEGTAVPSPSAGSKSPPACSSPAPGGELPQSTSPRIVDVLPEDVWLTVNTRAGTALLQGGRQVAVSPGTAGGWLLDEAGREPPVRLESQAGQYEASHTLYAIDGSLLLECGELYPTARLGSWVFLNSQLDKPASHARSLDTGEIGFEGYYLQAMLPGGYALLDTAGETTGLPPLLLDPEQGVARRFEGYSGAYMYQGCDAELPGYIVLIRPDRTEELYSLARDEVLPGGFVAMVDCGQPAGLFETDAGWVIRDLASDQPLNEPDTGSPRRLYSVYTPQVRLCRLEGADGQYCLEYPGGTVLCADAGPTPNGWYAQQEDGSVLLIGRGGELLDTLMARPGAAFWGSIGMRPGLRLRCWEDGCELLNRDGVFYRSTAQYARLDLLAAGRYAFSRQEDGVPVYSLLDGDGAELLAGLDGLYATALPNVWHVQKNGENGLMNEAGQWLWREGAPDGTASAAPPTALPADARCGIPATNVSNSMLLLGDEVLPLEGSWVHDRASGRVMGRCEMVMGEGPWRCRLYGLTGELLLDDARVAALEVLGRWAFVHTGSFDYGDGWAVSLDTGETRFRGCELGAEAAPGVFIVNQAAASEQPPADPPCLVDAQLRVLRRFEGFTAAYTNFEGLILPGYLFLWAEDGSCRLYDLARDEVLPGELLGVIDPQQGLVQLKTGRGAAVFALDTRSWVSEFDAGGDPRRYIAYAPDFKLYLEQNPRYRRTEYYAERQGEAVRIRYAGYTAAGYYVEQLDGSAQLLDSSGRLLQPLEPHPGAGLENYAGPFGSTLPYFTLRSWPGGYELLGRDGPLEQGETAGYSELYQLAKGRYALCTVEYDQSQYALLSGEGAVLLSGLDQLFPTELPGVWAVQKRFEVGLMNEDGSWLFCRDVTPAHPG